MSALVIDDLTVRYGRLTAVRGLSLTLDEGALLFVTGPNGAGKSSLMRAIAGAVRPASGRITLHGQDITGATPEDIARAGLSLVPEGREVFGGLTVEENLRVAQRPGGPADALDEVYATFPILRERRHGQAGLLSGGQQQMLAIGRALMTGARLIAIDEPSLGLAPNITDQVYETLLAIQKRRSLTLLVVEQSSTRAVMAGGRMVLMRGGQIVLDGDARELGRGDALRDAYFGVNQT